MHEAEDELRRLNDAENKYGMELDRLKSLEERYRNENGDLQRRIDEEAQRNQDLGMNIKDAESKIRIREDQIMQQRKELDGARYSNETLVDNTASLAQETEALNNHIRVLNGQNEDLTKELDHFVEANEAIRSRLDRRNRVMDLRRTNDQQLQKSIAHVAESRSPPRNKR